MKQLIEITDMYDMRPVFVQGATENVKRYKQLKSMFARNKEYQILAKPVPETGGKKIKWHTEFKGEIIPFTSLTEEEQERAKGILKYQVNNLYRAAIKYLQPNERIRNKSLGLFQILDGCFEIPSYDNIRAIRQENGKTNFCIIRWGFTSDGFNSESGLIAKLIPLKVFDLKLCTVYGNGDKAPLQTIHIKCDDLDDSTTTDSEASVYLEDVPFFEKVEVWQDDKGKKINEHDFIFTGKSQYEVKISETIVDMNFTAYDEAGKVLPNEIFVFEFNGTRKEHTTDEEGRIILKDIPQGTKISTHQLQDEKEINYQDFICLADKKYRLHGTIPPPKETTMLIKLIDQDDKVIKGATISIYCEGKDMEMETDCEGYISLGQNKEGISVSACYKVEEKKVVTQELESGIRTQETKTEIREYKDIFMFSKDTPEYILKGERLPEKIEKGEAPREGCRAYFSGALVGGKQQEGISAAYVEDKFSEYVGTGEYTDNSKAFPKAVASTFDGIAIDRNTRVIIYSKKNFKGEVLLDKTGPAIINNGSWKNDNRYNHINTKNYEEPLQSNFPQSVRIWTDSDMKDWSHGSVKVLCIPVRGDKMPENVAPLQEEELAGAMGNFRVNLQWYSEDDLDLMLTDPCGNQIYFGESTAECRGETGRLDVDANVGNLTNQPQENIFWDNPPKGKYKIEVIYYQQNTDLKEVPFNITLIHGDLRKDFSGTIELKEKLFITEYSIK